MTIICSNKNCGHVNADGNSYCVKCGEVLPGKFPNMVVIKSQYENLKHEHKELESLERENSKQKKELDELKKNGFAPQGFHLEKDIYILGGRIKNLERTRFGAPSKSSSAEEAMAGYKEVVEGNRINLFCFCC